MSKHCNTSYPVQLDYHATLTLRYGGDCGLLGLTPERIIYVEETYDEDGWAAQHQLQLDGTIVQTVDEQGGRCTLQPLILPPLLTRPTPVTKSAVLNFSGARLRGLRESERITDIVRPLELATRMTIINRLGLAVTPMALLGLAESAVLAEAQIGPDTVVVCRRLRFAYALPQLQHDQSGMPYDYDTVTIHTTYAVHTDAIEDLSLEAAMVGLPGVTLHRPMDCLCDQDLLLVADGGSTDRASAIHVWRCVHLSRD